jgi:hypothetical protein
MCVFVGLMPNKGNCASNQTEEAYEKNATGGLVGSGY